MIETDLPVEELGPQLEALAGDALRLSMISSRGTKVYPSDELVAGDHVRWYRARFVARDGATVEDRRPRRAPRARSSEARLPLDPRRAAPVRSTANPASRRRRGSRPWQCPGRSSASSAAAARTSRCSRRPSPSSSELGVAVRAAGRVRPPDARTTCSATPRRRPAAGSGSSSPGAGGAAHLPGMLAAKTTLPVIGVPIPTAAPRRPRLAALDRPDAARHPGRDGRHRQRRRTRRSSRPRSSPSRDPALAERLAAYRAAQTEAVLADPTNEAPLT